MLLALRRNLAPFSVHMNAEELDSHYKSLASKGKHAILSLVPNYWPLQIKGTLPVPLECLFNIENMALPFNLLLKNVKNI